VADDQTLTPIDGGIEPGVPVFGRRTGSFDQRKFRRFALEIESDSERFNATFEAFVDADAGAIFGLMSARTQMQQAQATAVLLGTSLRDDDGVSDGWTFPEEPVYDDDGELLRFDEDPDDAPPPPRYEWWDGTLLTEEELRSEIDAFDPLEVGSSRRRFGYVMQSPGHRVQLAALNELAQWLIGDAAKVPTQLPKSSRPGQSRTPRTSGARSR
jgi:hypothetical protein